MLLTAREDAAAVRFRRQRGRAGQRSSGGCWPICIPEYLGLGIPIGLMLGVLLAFRKLALSSELDSLRGVGLGYGRLLRVPYIYAIVLMAANVCHRRLRPALRPICLSGAALRAALGRARRLDQGRRVHQSRPADDACGSSAARISGTDLHGVFLRAERRDGRTVAVTADARHLPRHRRSQHDHLPADQRPAGPRCARLSGRRACSASPAHDLPIDLPAIEEFRGRGNAAQGADPPRARPARPRPAMRPRRGATRRAPISISAWSRW